MPEIPDGQRVIEVQNSELIKDEYTVPGNWSLKIESGDEIETGVLIAQRGDSTIEATHGGRVLIKNRKVTVSYDHSEVVEYEIPPSARLLVQEGDKIEA